jgi:ZIP family zinc transporter
MEDLFKITVIGLISGMIGTGAGGLMAFFVNNISNRTLGLILEFSSGLMMAVVCFELIPEAFGYGGTVLTFTGLIFGVLSIIFIENKIKKMEYFRKTSGNAGLLRAGILTAVGIAMHNFPEGFAVGAGFEASLKMGMTITAVIAIHDIPEGIAMAVPMRVGGFSKPKAFWYTILSGVPMGLGAFFGAMLGEISNRFISVCLGFAGGAMLYIVCGELIPESKKLHKGRLPAVGNVIGILCGIIVSTYN